ncbi:MAG TPA: hypothetical protein VFB03_01910 [Candidatus Saccharimonadales bacterium]|nr:hypothetical protein [Candidatus Saccharimonadales bacterium]
MKLFQLIRSYSLILISILFLTSATVSAAQSPTTSGISISPTRSELTLSPGEASTLKIIVKNVTSGDIVAKPIVNDFEADNSSGNPKIVLHNPTPLPTSIQNFVQGLQDVPLKKGEQRTLDIVVQVPPHQSAGAYYGLIRYEAVPVNSSSPTSQTSLSLSASVSTIVLVTVPGNLTQKLELKAIHVYRDDKESTFFLKKPNTVGVEVKNLGNAFAKPFGKVVLQSMSGKQVYSYEVNNANLRANVLPSSSRIFKDALKNVGGPGRYTLVANISYGSGSDILVAKKSFWYIPLWLLIVILVVIIILILVMYTGFRRMRGRRYHRHRL